MKTVIPVNYVKIGMYVVLPKEIELEIFGENEPVISSRNQIEKISAIYASKVMVDLSKSFKSKIQIPAYSESKLNELMKTEAPETKSDIIRKQTLSIMESVMNNPSTEQIIKSIKDIKTSVRYIIENDDMTEYFIKINQYDDYTYAHSVNVGIYSVMLTKHIFGLNSDHDLEELGAGFFLHDIGKVKIDPKILNKPGRFTPEEFEIMKSHPEEGYNLLKDSKQLTPETSVIVMQHHERADGKGYPLGLTNEEIHEYGKICSIADVFDALTSKRSYKEAMTTFEALLIMKNEMINHFSKEFFSEFVFLFTPKS